MIGDSVECFRQIPTYDFGSISFGIGRSLGPLPGRNFSHCGLNFMNSASAISSVVRVHFNVVVIALASDKAAVITIIPKATSSIKLSGPSL
jgi:hypothetical protein